MTEEQIKQNAEEYASKLVERDYHEDMWLDLYDAHIAGAHSRDEEIELLRHTLSQATNMLRNGNDKLLADYMVQKIELDQLRNPWISVEDRLPEEFQMVFVHMQGGSFDCAIYTNGAFERSLQLKFGMKDEGYTIISWEQKFKSNITHWMPIPQIEKGE